MVFIDFLGKPFLRGVRFLWAFTVVGLLVVVGGCCFGFGCCCLAVAGFCWFVMVLGVGWADLLAWWVRICCLWCLLCGDFVVWVVVCGVCGWCLCVFRLWVTLVWFVCGYWFVVWLLLVCVVALLFVLGDCSLRSGLAGHCWLAVFACYFGWLC